MRMRVAGAANLVLAGFLALSLAACDEQPAQQGGGEAPPVPVSVIVLEKRPIASQEYFIGRTESTAKVELRARVTGFLEQRLFTEGDNVHAGQLLFTIEKAPFEAAMEQAKANLASAEAQEVNAEIQVKRGEELIGRGNISQSEQDTRTANYKVAQAEVLAARAEVETAAINLGYTDISTPIDGRIGLAAVDPGNLVSPDTGVLATVVSEDPLYVTFPVGQTRLMELRRKAQEQGLDERNVIVNLVLGDGSTYPDRGTINFVDVQADASTDTVLLRATIPNDKRLLVPNQTVRVVTALDKPEEALAVPQGAILLDQQGAYVFVVNDKSEAEQRRVKYRWVSNGLAVLDEGVQEGEQVVVEGLQRLRPNAKVQASPATPEAGGGDAG